MAEALSVSIAVSAAVHGSVDAFDDLYVHYAGPLQAYVRKTIGDPCDAEDLCQEIWLKAYNTLKTLRNPDAFSSWLYQIALHASLSERRKLHRRDTLAPMARQWNTTEGDDSLENDDDRRSLRSAEPDPLGALLRREEATLAWEALASLPPRQHLALYLREVEGHSYQEIAARSGASASAVESLLVRARRGFISAYQALEAEPELACQHARAVAGAIGDGQATPVELTALRLHQERCTRCQPARSSLRRIASLLSWPFGAAGSAAPSLPFPRGTEWLGAIFSHLRSWIAMGAAVGAMAAVASTLPGGGLPPPPGEPASTGVSVAKSLPAGLPDGGSRITEAIDTSLSASVQGRSTEVILEPAQADGVVSADSTEARTSAAASAPLGVGRGESLQSSPISNRAVASASWERPPTGVDLRADLTGDFSVAIDMEEQIGAPGLPEEVAAEVSVGTDGTERSATVGGAVETGALGFSAYTGLATSGSDVALPPVPSRPLGAPKQPEAPAPPVASGSVSAHLAQQVPASSSVTGPTVPVALIE